MERGKRHYLGHDIRDGGGANDDAVLVLQKDPRVDPRLQTNRETEIGLLPLETQSSSKTVFSLSCSTTIASIMEEKSTLKTGRGEIGETTGTKRQPCLICWQDFKEGGTFKNIARPFKNVSRNWVN